MPNRFGPRGVLALMIPQQNANMQPEYEAMRPNGVSNQIYRFSLAVPDRVPEAVIASLPNAKGCFPDMIVCGNSLEMRHWSQQRQAIYLDELKNAVPDVPIITATEATETALRTLGAKKVAVLSPMSETYSKSVAGFYGGLGFDVVSHHYLKVPVPEEIINVPVEMIHGMFDEMDSPEVDCFLHVGGALGIVDFIDGLEEKLGRPVVSVNAATYWYALRKLGVNDPLDRGGQITRLDLPEKFA
ncbi:hypothetical protein N9L47_01160 [Rhodobacteraceae bacterium]|nr:hypothetical protein [Paracoccaceae bacterium]